MEWDNEIGVNFFSLSQYHCLALLCDSLKHHNQQQWAPHSIQMASEIQMEYPQNVILTLSFKTTLIKMNKK